MKWVLISLTIFALGCPGATTKSEPKNIADPKAVRYGVAVPPYAIGYNAPEIFVVDGKQISCTPANRLRTLYAAEELGMHMLMHPQFAVLVERLTSK